jgi:hypothetical protein
MLPLLGMIFARVSRLSKINLDKDAINKSVNCQTLSPEKND